ncbi:MAG: hypothetical protein AMJ46_12395 [Latescibacteria bacterium DG_63]|nr:MAG: hypothetical protein AMJ46_12395 [Latescibacteria bacterium DG_63]
MKRLCLFQWPAIACVVTLLALTSPALGSKREPAQRVTNIALLERATAAAVDSMIRGLPSSLKAQVYLRPAVTHDAVWMVESQLGAELRGRGIQVIVSKTVAPTSMDESTQEDTTVVGDTLETIETMVKETEEGPGVMTLEYRITELGLDYPKAWRGHLIGRKQVERLAFVALHGRLIEDSSGALVWSGEGSATARDVVPASELASLEGKGAPWQKGTLPAGKLGGFVEPLVVAAIVAGLVYLFYSNKE